MHRLICPPGIEGIVVDVKIFTRRGQEKDEKTKAIEAEEMEMLHRNLEDEIRILSDSVKKSSGCFAGWLYCCG